VEEVWDEGSLFTQVYRAECNWAPHLVHVDMEHPHVVVIGMLQGHAERLRTDSCPEAQIIDIVLVGDRMEFPREDQEPGGL
jgi:hypothetical protein